MLQHTTPLGEAPFENLIGLASHDHSEFCSPELSLNVGGHRWGPDAQALGLVMVLMHHHRDTKG